MRKIAIFAALALSTALYGCDVQPAAPSGAQKESQATKQLQSQAAVAVGMPAIKNFTEKNLLKTLYELRDKPDLITYSYIVNMQGDLIPLCPGVSIGYGIPFSAQFTAPSVDSMASRSIDGVTTITTYQPEPNGLYMPDSTSATWVICQINGDLAPVYVEPAIIVSRSPLK